MKGAARRMAGQKKGGGGHTCDPLEELQSEWAGGGVARQVQHGEIVHRKRVVCLRGRERQFGVQGAGFRMRVPRETTCDFIYQPASQCVVQLRESWGNTASNGVD